MIHVLLVEDDPVISRIIMYHLKQEASYEVEWVRNAGEAMAAARKPFDVILLDILLPDVNGIELCANLREWLNCPILFISCIDDSSTIIAALEAGGDDFITKPFDNRVLVARIEANLRRNDLQTQQRSNNRVVCHSFTLDLNRNLVLCGKGDVRLSPQETRILHHLMNNAGRYLTAEEIYWAVWGKDPLGDTRSVAVHIHNIRKKLETALGEHFIGNAWGKGYIFNPGESSGTDE